MGHKIKKKKKFPCSKCSFVGKSQRGLSYHDTIKHPYVSPPPPRQTVKQFIRDEFGRSLKNGYNITLGSKLVFEKVVVVSKITKTEGSDSVVVDIHVITDTWAFKQ